MTGTDSAGSVRDDLRAAATQALKQRDRVALSAYRSALASIDNAEAVSSSPADRAGAVESSPVGIGKAEAQPRVLTQQDMIDIVSGEIAERRSTAGDLPAASAAAAQQLRRGADLLQSLVDRAALRATE